MADSSRRSNYSPVHTRVYRAPFIEIGGPKRELFVLANSNPRGGYGALSFPPALCRTPGQKDISWALVDGKTGEVLASIRTRNSRAYAATVAMMKSEFTDLEQADRLSPYRRKRR